MTDANARDHRHPRLNTVNTLRDRMLWHMLARAARPRRQPPHDSPMRPADPFRLVTLGRLALATPSAQDEPSLSKRRRKLAVLAVLALERRPLSRDTLVEMFWGEQEESRARHSLSDALSHLRRVLGRDAIAIGGVDVLLADRGAVVVDALEFAEAARAGHHERAVELYTGPFLEGVYVEGSASFEHWVDRQRRALHSIYLDSLRAGCTAARSHGDEAKRALLSARWLDVEPLSTEAALHRIESLRASGDADAIDRALADHERLSARLERDFGVRPAPEVERLADALRADREARRTATITPEANALPRSAVEQQTSVAAPPPGIASETVARTGRVRGRWIALAGAMIALTLLLAFAFSKIPESSADPVPERVAILPFQVRGGPDVGYLGEGMVDLLSTSLEGAAGLRTVDPRAVLNALSAERGAPNDGPLEPSLARAIARHFGAGRFVVGSVVEAGGRLRVSASLYDLQRDGAPQSHAEVEGTPAELFGLVDGLTSQLVAGTQVEPAQQLARIAALTTHSLPALKAYLVGEHQFRLARYPQALDAYETAISSDSTFPLAHYRVSLTLNWLAAPWDSIYASSRRAVLNAATLSPRAQLVVEAHDAWRRGAYDEAERLYRMLTTSHPDDVEGWYQLGEVLFHGNALRGRSLVESRLPFERALGLEPGHTGAMTHLARVAALEGRSAEADSLTVRLMTVDSTWYAHLAPLHAYLAHDATAMHDALTLLRRTNDELTWVAAERLGVVGADLTIIDSVLNELVQPQRSPDFRELGLLLRAETEAARGRWRVASELLRIASATDSSVALERYALIAVHPFLRVPREELRSLRTALAGQRGPGRETSFPIFEVYNALHPQIRLFLLGMLDVRLGDLQAARQVADSLQAMAAAGEPREVSRGFAESLRGHVAAAEGRREEAIEAFERGRLIPSQGFLDSPIGSQSLERLERGELLRALGREEEATAWLASLPETSLSHQLYRAPALLARARAEERRGAVDRAAASYGEFLALWKDCDPALRPETDSVRARLAAVSRQAR
jgi:DNA-binding SARP family transcriptional activator/tetratricopeptide (TPR) repeat protein